MQAHACCLTQSEIGRLKGKREEKSCRLKERYTEFKSIGEQHVYIPNAVRGIFQLILPFTQKIERAVNI